jgi:DNA-binding response OmpR family regulator
MARPLDAMGLRPPRRDITPTVLIVEDDAAVLESVAEIAKEGGYLVLSAGNADDAEALLER